AAGERGGAEWPQRLRRRLQPGTAPAVLTTRLALVVGQPLWLPDYPRAPTRGAPSDMQCRVRTSPCQIRVSLKRCRHGPVTGPIAAEQEAEEEAQHGTERQ